MIMKTILRNCSFVCILGIVLSLPPAAAETPGEAGEPAPNPYAFSATLGGGLLYGQGIEIVYKYADTDEYLSELLWDLKPLLYAGAGLSFAPVNPGVRPGFFTELFFKTGIPGKTGIMEDRDWLNDGNEMLTNYSRHDNFTRGAFLLDYTLGLSLPAAEKLVFRFYGAFSLMILNWESRDGYLQYAEDNPLAYPPSTYPWTEDIPKTPIYGRVITYSQVWMSGGLGASMAAALSDRFRLGFSVRADPLIRCSAQDDHLAKQFVDALSGGLLVEPKAELAFSLRPGTELALQLAYRQIIRTRGDSYLRTSLVYDENSQTIIPATQETFLQETYPAGGAAYRTFDGGLFLKIRF
jgi:outer membrane protease